MPTAARPGAARGVRLVGDPTDEVRSSFLRLAERFDPAAAAGLDATYAIRVAGHGTTTIEVRSGRCFVAPGDPNHAEARFATSASTWSDLVAGRIDGIAAFLAGRLVVTGDLNLAARFETLFTAAPGARRRLRTHHTRVGSTTIESLVSGVGPPVVLLHGLAATKVSFLPTVDGLADRFEVHALDLPGFGKSSKPLPTGRRYSIGWLADVVHGYLEAQELPGAHLVGNSLGGRVAVEVALRHPRSVRSTVGLGSAVAFDEYRRFAPLLRLSHLQWAGLTPVPVPHAALERLVRSLFHDPSTVPDANHLAAALDAAAALRDPTHRLAVLACARALAVDRAGGRRAYWRRLSRLSVPNRWIFGDRDRLVAASYAARVSEALPSAVVEVWPDVGHVPQFEVPARTNAALTGWLDEVEATR